MRGMTYKNNQNQTNECERRRCYALQHEVTLWVDDSSASKRKRDEDNWKSLISHLYPRRMV